MRWNGIEWDGFDYAVEARLHEMGSTFDCYDTEPWYSYLGLRRCTGEGGRGGGSVFYFIFLSSFGSGLRNFDAGSYLCSRYHGEGSTEGSVDRLSWFESVYSVMHAPLPSCDGAPARPFASRFWWSAASIRVLGMVRALSTGRCLGLLWG